MDKRRPAFPRLVYDARHVDFDPKAERAAYEAQHRRDLEDLWGRPVSSDCLSPPKDGEALYPHPPDSLDELDPETRAQFCEALGLDKPRDGEVVEGSEATLALIKAMYCDED